MGSDSNAVTREYVGPPNMLRCQRVTIGSLNRRRTRPIRLMAKGCSMSPAAGLVPPIYGSRIAMSACVGALLRQIKP
jgi:hypothetical protein